MRKLAAVVAGVGLVTACAGAADAATIPFRTTKVEAPISGGPWEEPRIATGPDGTLWVVTNDKSGTAFVYSSTNGGASWTKAPAPIAGQNGPTPDVDVIVLPTGRIIASELDSAGINFPTSFSDDRGKTWTQSTGSTQLADQDRQWFNWGPDPSNPGKRNVYLLFHNLASGAAQHNMFVATSHDDGASFGVPVPVTLPGSDAYTDLQCSDSGGPSAIWTNHRDGTVYAEFTTRASPTPAGDLGGCAPLLVGQPIEFNIVAGTRVWLAQSTDGGQTWTDSLAVDDAPTGQIVSMQVAYGGLDTAGNIYVAYPETPAGTTYPDYSGAGVKYKFAAPSKSGNLNWSAPRTFTPAIKGSPGHVLVHLAIGDPGQLEGFYWTGVAQPKGDPLWFMTAAQTLDGLSASPHVNESRISDVPADVGTASILMGACTSEGPVTGVVNGVKCNRSPDVWGVTMQSNCMPAVVWPAVDQPKVPGNNPGTWTSVQDGGQSLCGPHPRSVRAGRHGSCPDRIPPVTTFKPHRVTRAPGRFVFRGTSHDRGCKSANLVHPAAKVAHVDVSIAKVRGKGVGKNCRFLTPKGRLTPFKNCRRPVLLRARGTTHWRFTVKGALPAGNYRAVARGVDVSHNKERPAKRRNIIHFRVR